MRWTPEDEKELMDWYELCGSDIPSLLNKGYTKSQIRSKAFRMGLSEKNKCGPGKCDLTEQQLLDMYHGEYMTIEQIAEKTGWAEQTIYRKMHEYEVPLTGKFRYTKCSECGKRIKAERADILDDDAVLCDMCKVMRNLGI